jgi:CheY-like chemotaxis protein
MNQEKTRPILIVEDEEADIMLINIVLESCGVAGQAVYARNGEEALDLLYCRGKYEGNTGFIPALVLLDLKMPKVTGLEVLKQIRADERFKSIPVVIFTSSSDEKDKRECLANGANDFIIKPISFEAFSAAVKKVLKVYLF